MVKPVEVDTRVKLRVTVRAKDVVPSGKVKIRVKGAGKSKSWTKTLSVRGRTSVLLPRYARTGKVKVVVRYRGDDKVEAGKKKIRFAVVDRGSRALTRHELERGAVGGDTGGPSCVRPVAHRTSKKRPSPPWVTTRRWSWSSALSLAPSSSASTARSV